MELLRLPRYINQTVALINRSIIGRVCTLLLLFLMSCRDRAFWSYQEEPRRGMGGAELTCQSEKQLNGMRLQLLRTEEGMVNLLGIFFGQFSVDEDFCTTIYLRSGELRTSYRARCHEGRQRCLLPREAVEQLRTQLEQGEEVVLYTKQQMLKISPTHFKQLYHRLESIPIPFQESRFRLRQSALPS